MIDIIPAVLGRSVRWVFKIPPAPASRPRMGRYGAYYSKSYTQFRNLAKRDVPKTIGSKFKRFDGPLLVDVLIGVERKRSSKSEYPNGDVDNYVKAVLDALNEIAWNDDKQVVVLRAIRSFKPKNTDPHFIVQVTQLESLDPLIDQWEKLYSQADKAKASRRITTKVPELRRKRA